MALTNVQLQAAASWLARKIYIEPNVVAVCDGDNLIAVVTSIDTAMATTFGSVPPTWAAKTIKGGLVDNLPEPFQSNSTVAQKSWALVAWALAQGGNFD